MDGNYKDFDELMDAFYANDEETFVRLLEDGADPNAYIHDTENGKVSILSNIVRKGSVNLVEHLLKRGANPNFQDEDGETPLFDATDGDSDLRIQELLYKFGADKNHRNNAGNTPLMQLAIRCLDYGYTFRSSTLFNLLDGCSDFHQTNSRDQNLIHVIQVVHKCILSEADASEEHTCICVRFLQILLMNGLSSNTTDGSLLTPLHYAASVCCENSVQFLIKKGANVHARSISGQTPIHFLGINPDCPGFSSCLHMLLGQGYPLDDVENHGRNLLHYITSSNKVTCSAVEIVLQKGLRPDGKDKFGLTPLHLCSIPSVFTHPDEIEDDELDKCSISDVLKTLVKHGACVNAMDKMNLTALHYALRYEKKQEVVETLLKLGADANLQTMTGETALHRATLYPSLLKLVLKRCHDVNAKDNFGSTALHWAVYYFAKSCIEQLLNAGAVLEVDDNDGENPRQVAIKTKRTSLFKCLGIFYCRTTHPLPCPIEMPDTEDDERIFTEDVLNLLQNAEIKEVNVDADSVGDSDFSNNRNSKLDKECNGEDHMFCDCPLLQPLSYNEDLRIVNRCRWYVHCKQHRQSIASYIELMLNSKKMGMYVDTRENDLVAEGVRELLQNIASEIKNRNPIFECKIQLAGSWREGTKIVFPDEFDFKWVLIQFSSAFEPIEPSESQLRDFVKFRLKDEYKDSAFKDFVDRSNFLDGRKVVRVLYTILNDILFDQFPFQNLYPVKYLKTEKGSIDNLSFRWVGLTHKNMLIDIDVVPTLTPQSWLPKSIDIFKKLLKNLRLPKVETFSVVLKTPDSRFVKNWNTFFRISVSDLEVAIFKAIPEAILKGYILIKSLPCTLYYPQVYMPNEDYYRKYSITTYHVKTAFFHEMEEDFDNVVNLSGVSTGYTAKKWAMKIVRRLSACLDNDYLESFFVPGVNLWANDSLITFNNKVFYVVEVACIRDLLEIGLETLSNRHDDEDFRTIARELEVHSGNSL